MNKQYRNLALIIIPLIIIGFIYFGNSNFSYGTVYDAGAGELHTEPVYVENLDGTALTTYQLPVTVEYIEGMQTDFDDVRFYDGDTLLKHYKMSYVNADSAKFYVQIDCPAESIKELEMCFGNPDLTDASDDTIFDFFEHFEGTSVDAGVWTVTDSQSGLSVADSLVDFYELELTTFNSVQSFSQPFVVEYYHSFGRGSIGLKDATTGDYVIFYDDVSGYIKTSFDSNVVSYPLGNIFDDNIFQTRTIEWDANYVQAHLNDVALITTPPNPNVQTSDVKLFIQNVAHSSVYGTNKVDWVIIRQFTANPPNVLIGEITLVQESIISNTTSDEDTAILLAEFSDGITDATATITKPDASTVDKELTNFDANIWVASLAYADEGNYTVDNFKVNSGTQTINSSLEFEVAASETTTTTTEEVKPRVIVIRKEVPVEDTTTESIKETNDNVLTQITDGIINTENSNKDIVIPMVIIILILIGGYYYMNSKKK